MLIISLNSTSLKKSLRVLLGFDIGMILSSKIFHEDLLLEKNKGPLLITLLNVIPSPESLDQTKTSTGFEESISKLNSFLKERTVSLFVILRKYIIKKNKN